MAKFRFWKKITLANFHFWKKWPKKRGPRSRSVSAVSPSIPVNVVSTLRVHRVCLSVGILCKATPAPKCVRCDTFVCDGCFPDHEDTVCPHWLWGVQPRSFLHRACASMGRSSWALETDGWRKLRQKKLWQNLGPLPKFLSSVIFSRTVLLSCWT